MDSLQTTADSTTTLNELLHRRISLDEQLHAGSLPETKYQKHMLSIAHEYLSLNNFPLALDIFRQYNAREEIALLAPRALAQGYSQTAYSAFTFLDEKESSLDILVSQQEEDKKTGKCSDLFDYTWNTAAFVGKDRITTLSKGAEKWAHDQGVRNFYKNRGITVSQLLMAHALQQEYDVAIGISRGGVTGAYLMNVFGVTVGLVDAHKVGDTESFSWITPGIQEQLQGARVVVTDNDAISGRTARRVGQELGKAGAYTIDVALNHMPVIPNSHAHVVALPQFRNVYFAKDFSYKNLDVVVTDLEKRGY